MNVSFWLAAIGMMMNLSGTVLLIFSLPATFRFNFTSKHFEIYTPDEKEVQSEFQFIKNLFYSRVVKEKNYSIRLSLFLLVVGIAVQIVGLYLDS